MEFNGSFSLLPFAASVRYGAVPSYPTSAQFQSAAVALNADLTVYPEAHWQIEAIRERRLHPGRRLDDAAKDITARVAMRLYDLRFVEG